jgi:2-dehydropantoate 2-reductase
VKVVVVGAGGLGSYVGALLSRAGHDVVLVARGEHAEAIRREGLRVDSFEGDFVARPEVIQSARELDGADLTLVAVKAYSLDEVAPQLTHLARAGSVIVSVLNGVDVSERLAELGVPSDRLVDGIAYMTAFRVEPGRVERRAAHQRLVVGSYAGAGGDAVGRAEVVQGWEAVAVGGPNEQVGADAVVPLDPIERVVRAFVGTGVEVVAAEDIRVELWRKMAVVCSLSVICALSGRSMGPIRAHRFGAELQRRAIAEVIDVGRANGVDLPEGTEREIGTLLDAFPDDFHPSVIHDLKGGRRTEMEELGGVIVRLGRARDVPVPLHEAATLAVQVQEGMAAG